MIEVLSPWDGGVVGEVARSTVDDVAAAVSCAVRTQIAAGLPQHERAAILERAVDLLVDRAELLATTITSESGKPITAARVEVERARDTLRYCAIEARTLTGEVVPVAGTAVGAGHTAFSIPRPIGVVAAITPFNFPLNLCCHKLGAAIAAGCAVVHKPASSTPLTAVLLHGLLRDAGLPYGWLQMVAGSGSEVGDTLVRDPRISLVTFTGSSEVGWGIRQAAPRAHVALELGNSTPLIVHHDADIDRAAAAIISGGYGFAGQSCISVQRVIVHARVHEQLMRQVSAGVADLAVGDPRLESTVVGPVIDATAHRRIIDMIERSIASGATLTSGAIDAEPPVIAPFVLDDVVPGMPVFDDELFGPGVAVSTYELEGEAIELANATRYGLQAGLFTSDVERALRVAPQIEFAAVTINETPTFRADQMPYGGIGESGTTREGPAWAVRSMLEPQLLVFGDPKTR